MLGHMFGQQFAEESPDFCEGTKEYKQTAGQ